MAAGMSQYQLERYKFPRFARLHLLIKLVSFRTWYRRILLFLSNFGRTKKPQIICTITGNLENNAGHFRQHGWVFIENIFPDNVHKALVENWPPFFHFHPVKNIYKSYDVGLIDKSTTIQSHPMIGKMYEYFHSTEFLSRLQKFTGDDVSGRYAVTKVMLTRAYHQSSCIPHVDSFSPELNREDMSLNFLFFVNGTGGTNAGGTCILHNADGDVIFEPTNLENSCMIYRSENIYHGFPPMRAGTYRWMILVPIEVSK